MKRFLTLLLLILATMPFGLHSQQSVTVNSTDYSSYSIPISGGSANNYQKCHFVLPAENLTTIGGKLIYSLSFYSGYSSRTWTNGSFSVYLDEVNYTEMSDFADVSTTTRVYTGELSVVDRYMTVIFETPYEYKGGNLLVCFEQTVTTNNNNSAYFYCSRINGKYPCVYGYDSNSLGDVTATQSQYTPYTIIYYADSAIGNIYVKEGGSGDKSGFSWDNASDNLDNAMALTKYYGKRPVWVAGGTYYGSGNASNDVVTLLDGVNLYGGFAGNEPENYDLSQRDFTNHETILDGQNSQRVVKQLSHFTDTTYFDGFTVQNGYKTSAYSPYTGGGMSLKGKVYVRNCVVKNNYCSYSNGGGIYIDAAEDCRAVVENCEISGNSTSTSYNQYGGGIYCNYAILKNNTVTGNTSRYSGGGIYAINSTIKNCVVNNNNQTVNASGHGGGGMYVENSTVSNCTMTGNTARFGAGIFGTSSTITDCDITNNIGTYGSAGGWFRTNTTVTKCLFTGNNATYTGGNSSDYCGAMEVHSGSVVSLCTITNNSAISVGAVYLDAATIDNCLIANNTGEGYVGGIYMVNNATVINCDVVRNLGGGLKGSGSIKNTIVWGNERNSAVYNIEGENITATYCAVENGYPGAGGNILLSHDNTGSDYNHPRFANPSTTAGVDNSNTVWSWQLDNGSVLVNRGTSAGITPPDKDLAGNDRVQQGVIDIGCYESPYTVSTVPTYDEIVYVRPNGAGEKTGTSWDNATGDLNYAIGVARTKGLNKVWVAAGTYVGDGVANNNAFTIYNGISIYGGFAGTEAKDYDIRLRDLNTNKTILDGQNVQRVVYGTGLTDTTFIDGFTITKGKTSGSGAGMSLSGNSYIRNCIVTNNTLNGNSKGVGLYVYGVSQTNRAVVENCVVSDNTGTDNSNNSGGGMYCYYTAIKNTDFLNNTYTGYGGGVFMEYSTYRGGTVSGNKSTSYSAGGIYASYNDTISNVTVTGNSASSNAGGVFLGYEKNYPCVMENCTITRNRCGYRGGGAYVRYCSVLKDCVITMNKSTVSDNNASDRWEFAGGVFAQGANIINCVVTNNMSYRTGGIYATHYAYYNYGYTYIPTTIDNCLISNNSGAYTIGGVNLNYGVMTSCDVVRNNGGGMTGTSGGTVKNTIVWGNEKDSEPFNVEGASLVMEHCAVTNGYDGTGNITMLADNDGFDFYYPRFEAPSNVIGVDSVTANISWQLTNRSICVNRGTTEGLTIPDKDLAGNDRVQRDTIDIGCYESPYNKFVIPSYDDNIVYVKVGGAGTGTGVSWTNATGDLNYALGIARSQGGIPVWVAAGTYVGDSIASHDAFGLYNGVSLYGGFVGNEPADYDISLRDINTNKTILDGQKVQRVVYQEANFTDTTYIDGFTIQNGKTTGYGGGLNLKGKSYVRNCVIKNDTAGKYGGGVYIAASSDCRAVIKDCVISNNVTTTSSSYGGGGLHCYYTIIENVDLTNNKANGTGGGVYMENSTYTNGTVSGNQSGSSYSGSGIYSYTSSTIRNVTVTGNNNSWAVYLRETSSFENGTISNNNTAGLSMGGYCNLTNTTVSGNTGDNYGGVYVHGRASTVDGCTITGNTASTNSYDVAYSAGLRIEGGEEGSTYNTIVKNTVIKNNSGNNNGGAYVSGNYTRMENCLVANNTGGSTGGVYINYSGKVISCDIVRNAGGGVSNNGSGTMINTIVWGNDINMKNVSGLTAKNCAVTGGCNGSDNIALFDSNTVGTMCPRFVAPSYTIGVENTGLPWSWQLAEGSICVNRGTSDGIVVPENDLAGNDRVQQEVMDIGCYESAHGITPLPTYGDGIVYVTNTGAGSNDGSSWDNALSDINMAASIAKIYDNVKVWVAKGTYTGANRSYVLTLLDGVDMYGGFAGNEPADYDLTQRDFETNTTILDGQNERRVVGQEAAFTDTTRFDGFTVRNGYSRDGGGGMRLLNKSHVRNCVITGNRGYNTSGGVYVSGGLVEKCVITSNVISNNPYFYYSSGIWAVSSIVRHCVISQNRNDCSYTAIVTLDNSLLDNCLLSNNSAISNGSAVYMQNSSSVINCDIVNNVGNGVRGYNNNSGDGSVVNTIIWGNSLSQVYSPNLNVTYCAVTGGFTGTGNISLSADNFGSDPEAFYPCFLNPTTVTGYNVPAGNWSWQLTPTSACKETGTTSGITVIAKDLAGTQRVIDDIDMGCYEFNSYLIENTVYEQICEGESYSGYGFVVEEPAVGNKTYTNVGTSYLGLDSIMHLNLTVNPKYLIEEERFVCDSLSIRWHGKTITDNGTYYDSLTSSHSCDSVYMFTVEFLRQPVGDFTMMIPADNATVKTMPLTLAWATVTGATSYDIYLWEENETEPGEPYVQGLANSYVNVSSVLNGHTYHWYVIARNACHETTSSVMTFTLDITPSLALSNHDIEFGEVTLNQTASRSVAVSTYYPMDVITMNIEGDDAAMFSYSTTTGWNDMNGGIMVVSFNPTTPKFNYDASVIVNCGDLADTISLSGGVANLFTFDTNVDGDVFAMGSTIPITGSVTDWTGGPAANIEVEVGVTVMNTKRTVMTETDANGHFSTTFELTPNESGYYTVNSGRAGYTGNAVHDEFNIPGIALVNNDFKYCLIDQGYSMTDSIRIRNKSNLPLNSIQLTALTNIAGCSWSASPVSLSGLDEGYIVYTITGSELTEGNQYQELKLKATSAEGAEIQFSVWYYCKPARGNLDVWPNMLTTTMTKGQSKIVDVMLVNGGTSETGAVTVELPNENWLSLVGSNTMSSIPVNDTAYFSLRLSPGENIDLVQYTGSVVIHSERGDDKVMYYNINAVSESTGTILVDATDEYTYNTNGGNGPHLAGAYVTITNYYSLETVAQGYTDEDGLFHADSYTNKDGQRTEGLPEGYYRVKVTADQHDEFVNNISVGAGRTTRVNAFMQYQAITYSWDVQPTEIQDEYTFELVTVFETNVPKPVITIDHTGTRDLDYGETDIFNLIITNHGLITAYENSITLDQMDEYSFVPLYDFIDSIPAQTTIIVPCQYTHLEPGRGYNRSSGCYVQAHTKNYYRCGMDRQWQLFKSDYIAGHECALFGSGMLGTLSIGAGGWGPSTPIYFGDGGGGIGTVPSSTSSKPAATSNESCTPCAMTGLGLLNSVAGCIPGLSGVKQAIQCGVTGLVSAALTGYNDYHSGASAQEQLRNQGLNAVNTAECLAEAAGITVAIPVGMFNCVYGLLGSVNDAAESCYHTENAKNRFVSYDAPFNFADYYAANCGFFIRQGLLIENIRIASRMSGHFMQLFREDAWQEEENSVEFLNCILNLSRQTQEGTISDEAADNLASTFVGTSVSSSDIHGFINRWNRTIYYWNAGYHTTGDVPDGMSYDFLEYPDEVYEYAHEAQEIYKELISECQDLNPYFHLKDGEGGDDYALIDGFIEASDYIMEQGENTQSNSVCARVTVQFSQTMTMTREAFNGTFSVHNGNEVNSIKEIELNFVVKDKSTGNDCTSLFQINTTSLNNITGIDGDGTLGAGLDGTALIQFIPTKNAAPTTPKVYSFGGTFAFLDPYTEENVVFDLYPVDLTVNPSPDLYVDYFMQRDILGDDAFTEDKVEPSIPAELGVRIHNKGMGMAKNVNLETAEPEIVDNEKGLAIDFAMYGASFNGNDAQIGLMNIPFGNIESGKTGVGEWLFTSSLLGHFISYSANVIHNNSFGNPELSLVSSLRIHELIHPIRVYGAKDDDINDFLVNDDDDANDIPDTIHFSHGGKTSVGVFDAITFDDYVTREDTIVTLTVDPSRIGWNYGNCEDPGQDKYELVSCTRDSDGQEIPLQNVWQTFVTLHDQADPLYENKLHIIDTLSNNVENVTYTLVYTLKTNLLDVEEIITGIDDPSVHIEYPLTSFQVKFNEKIIDSTFTYRDMTLKCNNGDDLMNENVVITKVADSLYNVDITGLTNETGYYVLNVHTLNIKDERGYTGYNGKQATWIQYITAITQNDTLVAGWNWWSTYIEQSTISGLDSLEKTLGSNGLQIKSHLAFVDNYYPTLGYNYWYGSLTDIDNESSYRLKLVDDGVTTVKGPRSHADEHEITINPEWNWIGYPLDTKRNVNTATDGFTPEANDIMKSHNESSIYYSGYGWYPVINLEPGKGYMYKSNADVAKTLTYNVSRNEDLATPDAPHLWTTNRHAFADNLTVIAAVYVDGERLADGNMELGAFVNGECRGSAILKHFPPLDCYYAVLTVSGEDGEAINFGLIDRIGGVMNFNSLENMVFEKNAVAGDIENPYEVRFSTASNSQMTFSMYPNPVEKGRTITLDIPETEMVTEVVITDILGTVIRRNTDGSRVVKGLTTRGVYDIQVFTASGNIYHGRLIVK